MRGLVNRLAYLGDAGGADRPAHTVEIETGRVPLQTASGDDAPGHPFEVAHGVFVVDLVDRHRHDLPPVVGHPAVLLETRGDVLGIAGPTDRAEIGHPARHGHVAEVAPAVEEGRTRKQRRQKSQVQIVVGHLVRDSRGTAGVQRLQPIEVLVGQAVRRFTVQLGYASQRRLGLGEDNRNGFKRLSGQP